MKNKIEKIKDINRQQWKGTNEGNNKTLTDLQLENRQTDRHSTLDVQPFCVC